jgi:predicted nuclease of predicted toxin-antitoxin system
MAWEPIDITKDEIDAAVRAFAKKARFLVDENMDGETAPFLRSKGWNTKSISEAGLQGRPDEDVLGLAHREDRILLTHDDDFLDDRRFPPHRNPGVVVLPGANGDTYALVRALLDLLAILAPYREFVRSAKVVFRADGSIAITARAGDSGRIETSLYRIPENRGPEVWTDHG